MRLFTNSELKTFKRCRRKWYLGEHLGWALNREKKHGAASLGTRVHLAMQAHAEGGLEAARAAHDARLAVDVLAEPEQELEIRKEAEKAWIMVEGFDQWLADEGADAEYRVLAAEHRIEVKLDDETGLLGKLDRRVLHVPTGLTLFEDFKTVDDFSRVGLLQLDEQMRMYCLLERLNPEHEGPQIHGALYTMMRKVKRTARAKPPFYMRITLYFNEADITNFHQRVLSEIADIRVLEALLESGADPVTTAYPNPTRDCSWDCDFLPLCGSMDDGSDWQGLLASLYRRGNPLARYDSPTTETGE